jgi:hypothetical protein
MYNNFSSLINFYLFIKILKNNYKKINKYYRNVLFRKLQ